MYSRDLIQPFEIITTTARTIPYYTINLKHLSYCWMPDLENQECMAYFDFTLKEKLVGVRAVNLTTSLP